MVKTKEPDFFPYRVLDLTDEMGFLCGKILADLGADVIKVEKPGGDKSRNIEPFYKGIPDPEKSLYWWAHNLNKRGITLNIETVDGQELFKKLVKTSDFVIESFPPGYMNKLGLGYADLCQIKPDIIVTSITPFGQSDGPYRDYKASDLTLVAMGGLLYITGFHDRPPVRVSFEQSELLAGSQAATATMVAHSYRAMTGEGQHVDVSIQACIAWVIAGSLSIWQLGKVNLKRFGNGRNSHTGKDFTMRLTYPCRDGFVMFDLMGGRDGANSSLGLVKWMDEEGMADDFIRNFDFQNYDVMTSTQEIQTRLESHAARFFLKHTVKELDEEAFARNIMLAPVNTLKEVLESSQLQARDFWQEVEHPELKAYITYPGTFFKSTAYKAEVRYRPPLIGEHNQEIYQELGLSEEDLVRLKQSGAI